MSSDYERRAARVRTQLKCSFLGLGLATEDLQNALGKVRDSLKDHADRFEMRRPEDWERHLADS